MGYVVFVLVVVVLVHGYVYRRGVHDLTHRRRLRIAGALGIAVLGLTVATALLTRNLLSPDTARPLHYAGYLWLAVAMYLGLLLAIGELVRLAVRFLGEVPSSERRLFLSRVIAGTAALGAVGIVTYGGVVARQPRVERREVLLDRLDPAFDGFTVAAISDIHLGPLVGRSDLAGFVQMINESTPDIVAVVGDMVDGTVAELGGAAEPLADIVAPTYFVTGNHEYFSDAAGSCVPRNSGGLEAMILGLSWGNTPRHAAEACL